MIARFLEHGGFREVTVVGGSGDGGADIVAWKRGQRWVVQAKYRQNSNTGKNAVEEAFRAHWNYEADVTVVAANREFSPDALSDRTQKTERGFNVFLWGRNFFLQQFEELGEFSAAKRVPRDYQRIAIDAVKMSLQDGRRRGLLTLATGLGKTMVASTFIAEYLESNRDAKVLVLAHMTDLVKQLDRACWPQFSKYTATHVWTDGEKPSYSEGVTFATWQSVAVAWKNGEPLAGMFDLVVVDECHHAPSESFRQLLLGLNPSYLLGVTATPWRGDGENLRPLFGDPIFTMDVVQGMQLGYLAEVDYHMMLDGIDWDEIRRMSNQGHTVKDLNQTLYVPERDMAMIEMTADVIQSTPLPRALVFCRSIAHAERLANYFRQFDIAAGILHSDLDRTQRFRNLTNFRAGDLKVLISIEMLNEGIDVPEVNIVVFARVTHSRRIFLQQLGRGLRLSDKKTRVKVLDFVADIRRVAAGIEINKEASRYKAAEVVHYPDGEIVKFNNYSQDFFQEYLSDMASIDDLDETATLNFPI
jgi:superfamily II DNA or RNA helicase